VLLVFCAPDLERHSALFHLQSIATACRPAAAHDRCCGNSAPVGRTRTLVGAAADLSRWLAMFSPLPLYIFCLESISVEYRVTPAKTERRWHRRRAAIAARPLTENGDERSLQAVGDGCAVAVSWGLRLHRAD
jgi:hypothetical protein